MAGRLESVVNIVTLVTCVVVIGVLTQNVLSTRVRVPQAHSFRLGDRFPQFEGVDTQLATQTLVMILRHDCQYCAQSVPFYQHLLRSVAMSATKGRTRIVLVTTDDAATANQYVRDNQLTVNAIVNVPPARQRELLVPGTPTLLIVDPNDTITRLWIGRLDPRGEAQVTAALSASSAN